MTSLLLFLLLLLRIGAGEEVAKDRGPPPRQHRRLRLRRNQRCAAKQVRGCRRAWQGIGPLPLLLLLQLLL